MGGHFAITSAPGHGSTFSVSLSLPLATLSRPADEGSPQPEPLRLLVVDDEPVNRRVAVAMLAHLGCTADTAADGVEALEAIERGGYDVVFVDIQMPGMTGLELSRIVLERMGADAPRLVAMTASAFESDRRACRDAGMHDFVAKPIDLGLLSSALDRAARVRRRGTSRPDAH